MKFNWRKYNIILHRDLGYLFVGMTIIYGLSGIALNHLDDWDPSYIITNKTIEFEEWNYGKSLDKQEALDILKDENMSDEYKSHYSPSDGKTKIFLDNGSLIIDHKAQQGKLELAKRRPVFYSVNFMHYNPEQLWTIYSDTYSVALIFLPISGLFIIKGKKGIKRRGAILGLIGIIIPLVLMFLYI